MPSVDRTFSKSRCIASAVIGSICHSAIRYITEAAIHFSLCDSTLLGCHEVVRKSIAYSLTPLVLFVSLGHVPHSFWQVTLVEC